MNALLRKVVEQMTARPILIVTLLLLCACESGRPRAHLTYLDIERIGSNDYVIHYSADMDLLNVLVDDRGTGQITNFLICSLDGDPLFSADHEIEKSFWGDIGGKGRTPGPPYRFATRGSLSLTLDEGGSQRDLDSTELRHMLAQRESVPCKARIANFIYKIYFSHSMWIPTADILREIDKPASAWKPLPETPFY
ncbi:hypothetical protein KSS94_16400 [Pseudomonas fakonensis]|uniref:DUF3304 domain-containing protein n=1 Tax=Pseudomonas fakonensis TaxID=2842355 RepID=A0ABX8N1J2_9PSED|nr:hypothetical protein [Pseudomonas fakonensis]QXH49528.1 hypothetical protein KSS94_16400 [Pseudomonas fakonensis]